MATNKHRRISPYNLGLILALTLAMSLPQAQATEGSVVDQSGVASLNTITFYQINWSKDFCPVNDTFTITGKLHVFSNWSANVTKPNAAVFRVKVQSNNGAEPVFLQDVTIGNQPVSAPLSLELGKTYEFSAKLTCRLPGTWALGPELVVDDKTSISGPAKIITVTGRPIATPYPTPPNISEMLKQPAVTNLQTINTSPTVDVKVEQATYSSTDKTLLLKLAVKNQGKSAIRLGEVSTASSRFLDPSVWEDDSGYPSDLLMVEGLKTNDTGGTVKPGETGNYEAKATGGVWESIYHLSSIKDNHLSLMMFFTNETGEIQAVEIAAPLK